MLAEIAELLAGIFESGGKALFFGNGGSAADAHHITGELVGRFMLERKGLPALCLCADSSVMTSLGNDFGFEKMFSRQVEALGAPGDAAFALSTSGNSANVVNGIKTARGLGLRTVSLTGATGGRLAKESEMVLRCPSNDTPIIQQLHMTCAHIICGIAERLLFGQENCSQDNRRELKQGP